MVSSRYNGKIVEGPKMRKGVEMVKIHFTGWNKYVGGYPTLQCRLVASAILCAPSVFVGSWGCQQASQRAAAAPQRVLEPCTKRGCGWRVPCAHRRNDIWVDATSNRIREHGTCDRLLAEAKAKHSAMLEQELKQGATADASQAGKAPAALSEANERASKTTAKIRKSSSGGADTEKEKGAKKVKVKEEQGASRTEAVPGTTEAGPKLSDLNGKFLQVLNVASNFDWASSFDKLPNRGELPDYYQIIKEPLDLATMRAKVHKNEYKYVRFFIKDIKLIVKNAQQYNLDGSDIYKVAGTLVEEFEKLLAKVGLKVEAPPKRKRGSSGVAKVEDIWGVVLSTEDKAIAKTEAEVLQKYLFNLAESGEVKLNATLRCGPIKATLQPDGHFLVGDILERFPTIVIQHWILNQHGGNADELWLPITIDGANLRKLQTAKEVATKKRARQEAIRTKKQSSQKKAENAQQVEFEADQEQHMGCPIPARGLEPVLLKDAAGDINKELIAKRIGTHVTSFDNFIEWHDMCFACGSSPGVSSTKPSSFVHCTRCAEPYHRFCIDSLSPDDDGSNWLCYSCKDCSVCKSGWPQEGMLSCNNCNKLTHYQCLKFPPPKHTIEKVWLCSDCVKCKSCERTTPGDLPSSHWMYDSTLCYHCGNLWKMGSYCPLCSGIFKPDDWDTAMMECESCKRWVHSDCENLTKEVYKKLDEYDEADVHYYCGKCRKRNPETTQDATQYLLEQMDIVDGRIIADGLIKVFRDLKRFKQAWAFKGKVICCPGHVPLYP